MDAVIVIPARMGASRFPGKPLVDLLGKPMVQWVWEAAVASQVTERVLVATPDQEIVNACNGFGAESILTGAGHLTGTDRIAEVARLEPADLYVNVQGDEPLMRPESIRACAEPLLRDPAIQMASVYDDCPEDEWSNPAVVKVVTDLQGFALYFSRYPIPYPRGERRGPVKKHIGLYAYRGDLLQEFSSWPQTDLETAETLEQLRFMEHGVRIAMTKGPATELAIDTPEQADQVREILRRRAIPA